MAEGMRANLSEISQWVGGQLIGVDAPVTGVSTDSRAFPPGALFVALKGPRFDAHSFLAELTAMGAAGALVEYPNPSLPLPQIVVADSRAALGQLGAAWRQRLGLPLVAITGSNGKTTTKELIAAILAGQGPILATRGNLNNDLGVPLTLLRLTEEHRFGVIEMGANHAGEIAYLCGLAAPQVGVVTNAAAAHLEGFGSLEGVARAKGELFAGLSSDGVAVINQDSPFAALWTALAGDHPVITFGTSESATVRRLAHDERGLRIGFPEGEISVSFALLGNHNVMNALAAAAAAYALGVSTAAIASGLAKARAVAGRLEARHGQKGATLIDDTYNANPESLRAGLAVLAAAPGRRLLALGDMRELGEQGAELHGEAGAAARAAGVERLFATGELSRFAVEAFGTGGTFFETQEELITALAKELGSDVTVLIKGSRGLRMERVVQALVDGE